MFEKRKSQAADVILDNEFLDILEPEEGIEKGRRIFVNRNLRLSSIGAIGFDMDHTLAVYNRDTIEPLAFYMTIEGLIEKGYPAALKDLEYDKALMIRGLVIDKKLGNILKVDRHGYITTAMHSGKTYTSSQKRSIYKNERVDLKDSRFYSIDTLFGIPEVILFHHLCVLKDNTDDELLSLRDHSQIYEDIRDSIDKVHRDGSLKTAVTRDILRYFKKDGKLAMCLHKLRKARKKLFLLTNSEPEYTEKIMTYLLNGVLQQYPDYRDFFDLVIYQAIKPDFYEKKSSFEKIADKEFKGGNAHEMEAMLGASGDEIIYFGDHTFGDILVAKKIMGWRTAMVIEELEQEVNSNIMAETLFDELFRTMRTRDKNYLEISREFRKINGLRLKKIQNYADLSHGELKDIDKEFKKLFKKIADNERSITQNLENLREIEKEIKETFNPVWGPLFKAGMDKSNFGRQVENYACVYTSKVSNLSYYPADKYFKISRDLMPHEL